MADDDTTQPAGDEPAADAPTGGEEAAGAGAPEPTTEAPAAEDGAAVDAELAALQAQRDKLAQETKLEADIAALQAQRDELAAQAAHLDRKVHGGRTRHLVVGIMVVLSCLCFLTASVGFWVNRNLLKTDVWIERVGPLASDPAVQTAVGDAITKSAMEVINPKELFERVLPARGQILAVPLSGAVENFVHDKVDQFVRSPTFQKIWTQANETAHAQAVSLLKGENENVTAGQEKVELNLVPAINAVLAKIATVSPDIFGHKVNLPKLDVNDLPKSAQARIAKALGKPVGSKFGVVTIYDKGALSEAQAALKLFNQVFLLSVLLTLILVPATIIVSRRRRRTSLQLLFGAFLVLVLIRRAAIALLNSVDSLAKVPTNQRAVDAVLHAFMDPLLHSTGWILAGVGLIALVLVLTGPYPWVVSLRHGSARMVKGGASATVGAVRDESTVAWVAGHTTALQVAGGAAFVLALWLLNLSWWGMLAIAAVIGVFELWVTRLGSDASIEAPSDTGGPPPPVSPSVT